jgi:hypothetical protein
LPDLTLEPRLTIILTVLTTLTAGMVRVVTVVEEDSAFP